MVVETLPIPQHIKDMVVELDGYIQSATRGEQHTKVAESASLTESVIRAQLLVLGWDAVFDPEQHCWIPIPAKYTIVSKLPGPYHYPQRCYPVPEAPDRWLTIWEQEQEICFARWREAYLFVFAHQQHQQELLPQRRFCVRPPKTWGGDEWTATSAEQAEQMQRNYWLENGWVTPARAVSLSLEVFEHNEGKRGFYCRACQHAPCKYTKEQ